MIFQSLSFAIASPVQTELAKIEHPGKPGTGLLKQTAPYRENRLPQGIPTADTMEMHIV